MLDKTRQTAQTNYRPVSQSSNSLNWSVSGAEWPCLLEAPLPAPTSQPLMLQPLPSTVHTEPQHTAPPEEHIPDLPFSQPAAPNPLKAPAEELTEFHLVSQRGRYITSTISAGSEDAPRAHPSPSHPTRTHLLKTALPQPAGGQGGLQGTCGKQN